MTPLLPDIRLLSRLPDGIQRPAFEAFRCLYEEAFPKPNEQQDPEDWRLPPEPGGVQAMVLIAGTGYAAPDTVEVWGGIVAEYYPQSRCGLLAYLAVAENRRQQGLGRQLVEAAVGHLVRLAEENHQTLRGVFGETEDVRKEAIRQKGTFPAQRLIFHDRLGARWIDIDYVMPRITANKKRDPNLLLMAYPTLHVTLNPTTLPLVVVEEFLEEYYAQEQENPDDPRRADECARMQGELEHRARGYHSTYGWPLPGRPPEEQPREYLQVPLKALPRAAAPRLSLRDVAVCLHIVTLDQQPSESQEPFSTGDGRRRIGRTVLHPEDPAYICPVYHSYEIDILSYRFQDKPPIISACAFEAQRRVKIRFPEDIIYVAEGFERRIVGAKQELEVRVSLTASRFPETHVRIWHLALLPLHEESFSELDIIRLISFYYREQEQIDLLAYTTFEIDDDGIARSFQDFLAVLSEQRLDADQPNAGTIELNPAAGAGDEVMEMWTQILSALYRTTVDDQEGFRALEALYSERPHPGGPSVKKLLDACCGVVSGHFDYVRMSFAEMQDTLAPDSSAGAYAIWLNRATLTNMDLHDRMLERSGRTIGISPYLILPQAVLLHNEYVVDRAAEVARKALHTIKAPMPHTDSLEERIKEVEYKIALLTDARRDIEQTLYQHYIPNVFHYPGERGLYEVGSRTRGALEKKETVERLFNDLNAHLRDYNESMDVSRREERDQKERQAQREEEYDEQRRGYFLTLVTVLLSCTVLFDIVMFLGTPSQVGLVWPLWPPKRLALVLLGGVLVIVFAALYARPRRGRKV